MLTELHITNFAIIERLDIHFASGLITFTGETGAGKSIIVDAVETLLGGRAESILVRSGAERAVVEAIFLIPNASRQAIHKILEREELLDDPDYLALGREIRTAGRNVARINGRVANAGLLVELGQYLVDVHGQSEHLSLLSVSKHLRLLDRYAAAASDHSTEETLRAYVDIYQRLGEVSAELERLRRAELDAAQRADMLSFQVEEIISASLAPGEEAGLTDERTRLANAESLANLAQEALLNLDEDEPETPPATDRLGQATRALTNLAKLDPSQTALNENAQEIFENLNELATSLRRYLEVLEFNPKRLDQVEERLALIQLLKRKYGGDIPTILAFAETAQRQLEEIHTASERIEELQEKQALLLKQLGQAGAQLSAQRRAAARQMESAIERELVDLSMQGARFQAAFQQDERPPNSEDGAPLPDGRRIAFYPDGLEKIEFLIAPNPGEGFKPLAKIASGGETSRLMLALKNVLAQADQVPTLIFDEIDQGIGGRIGAVVGHKLWQLGRAHQVLCVTHLPQLAAYGEQHYHVAKDVQGARTQTHVQLLQDEARLNELAQMLGAVSAGTLQSARELLDTARGAARL